MAIRKSTCQAKIRNFNSWILTVIAEKDVHVFYVAMDDVTIVNVPQSGCYLFYYSLGPVLWQHLNLIDAEVVHKVASLGQLGDNVGELTLSKGLDHRDYILAILALYHGVDLRDVILLL